MLLDVVLQNMRPGVLDRLGLGYDDLRAVRPDVVMLSSSAVGARPTLYFGDCARVAAQRQAAASTRRPVHRRLRGLDMGHVPVRADLPGFDAVVVIVGIVAARRNQCLLGGLDIAGVVDGS